MPRGKRLTNVPLGSSATAATAPETATAAAAEASSVEWRVLTLAGTFVLAIKRRLPIGECVQHLHTEVARLSMHGPHSRGDLMLRYEGLDMLVMSEQQLLSINNSISMLKRPPKLRWWFMRGTNTWADFFSSYTMPTMSTMPNIGGRALSWTGSSGIQATCERLRPQTFDEVVCFSARQWYPVVARTDYIEQARIMLLNFMLSQNGILYSAQWWWNWPNGLQLDLYDLHRVLIALTRRDSLAFLTMMHNCNAIDILDPVGRWTADTKSFKLPSLTPAADRFLSDQEPSAQISAWLIAFTTRENLLN